MVKGMNGPFLDGTYIGGAHGGHNQRSWKHEVVEYIKEKWTYLYSN